MDYSNTNLHGTDLFKKSARKNGLMFKINFIKQHIEDLRLMDNAVKHEKFLSDAERLIKNNYSLTESQIRYIEFLYNKLGG